MKKANDKHLEDIKKLEADKKEMDKLYKNLTTQNMVNEQNARVYKVSVCVLSNRVLLHSIQGVRL